MNQVFQFFTWQTYVIGLIVYGLPVTLLSVWVYIRSQRDYDFAESMHYKVLRALLWPLSILVLQDDETTPALTDFVDPYDNSDGMWILYVIGGALLWPLRAFLWAMAMAMFVMLRALYHIVLQPVVMLGKLIAGRVE